jgi:hypothetical protein
VVVLASEDSRGGCPRPGPRNSRDDSRLAPATRGPAPTTTGVAADQAADARAGRARAELANAPVRVCHAAYGRLALDVVVTAQPGHKIKDRRLTARGAGVSTNWSAERYTARFKA